MITDPRNPRELAMAHAVALWRDSWGDLTDTVTSDAANRHLTETAEAVHQFLTAANPDIAELRRRVEQWEERMGVLEDRIEQLRVSVDDATNRVAEQLRTLRDQLSQRDQEAADALTPLIDRLNEIGADPADPVPTPVEPTDDGGALPPES